MKQELVQLAKDKGFEATFVYDKPFIYSSKEPLRWLFWMTELQKWLREVHNIHIEIYSITTKINGYYIVLRGIGFELNLDNDKQGNWYPIMEGLGYKVFNTYEQALEVGLFESLKLIEV